MKNIVSDNTSWTAIQHSLASCQSPSLLRSDAILPRSKQRKISRHRLDGRGIHNSVSMWRAVKRLTQTELAKQVGVSRRTIIGIENNEHIPAVSTALAIAEVFDAPVEDVFNLR